MKKWKCNWFIKKIERFFGYAIRWEISVPLTKPHGFIFYPFELFFMSPPTFFVEFWNIRLLLKEEHGTVTNLMYPVGLFLVWLSYESIVLKFGKYISHQDNQNWPLFRECMQTKQLFPHKINRKSTLLLLYLLT